MSDNILLHSDILPFSKPLHLQQPLSLKTDQPRHSTVSATDTNLNKLFIWLFLYEEFCIPKLTIWHATWGPINTVLQECHFCIMDSLPPRCDWFKNVFLHTRRKVNKTLWSPWWWILPTFMAVSGQLMKMLSLVYTVLWFHDKLAIVRNTYQHDDISARHQHVCIVTVTVWAYWY